MAKINREFFFDYVRLHLFGRSLNQSQVNGLTAIPDYRENGYSGNDDRWLAYRFATAHHETDRKFQAIEEYGKGKGKNTHTSITGADWFSLHGTTITKKMETQFKVDLLNPAHP